MAPKGDYRLQFWKGLVFKATAVAIVTEPAPLTVVSFHGFNGTLQGRCVDDLLEHCMVVMDAIPPPGNGPVIWAGDFNTFTPEHVAALDAFMAAAGFTGAIRVPYDATKTLDFVFTRQCRAELVETGHHESDHPFIVFDVFE
jgi:endonuclease/exonuclease/phosphatase (EEP) superfamily protein YafD